MEKNKPSYDCTMCGTNACGKDKMDNTPYPQFCATVYGDAALTEAAVAEYAKDDIHAIAIAAAEVETEGYNILTRIEEIMLFANKLNYKKLGIATCVGLINESRTIEKILLKNHFQVYGIACKVGAIPKMNIGIDRSCCATGINMCNPILQAKILNEKHTDLNLVVGLCVGHDSLFYKYSKAPVTTVITKDRVLGHNPAAAIYSSYYLKKLLN